MKLALLGNGKTGQNVLALAKCDVTIFNSRNLPTLEKLAGHDVIISFLPGHIFLEYFNLLIESKIPVVCGSTGFEWSDNQKKQLVENKVKWVCATNFSLGMNIVKNMIQQLSLSTALFDDYQINIHEIHHTKKLDAPSGTAKSWNQWLTQNNSINESQNIKDASMTYERVGDVIGFHEMTLTTADEEIKITHTAKDRSLFARGAIWAAQKIITKDNVQIGLTEFSNLVQNNLNELIQLRSKK